MTTRPNRALSRIDSGGGKFCCCKGHLCNLRFSSTEDEVKGDFFEDKDDDVLGKESDFGQTLSIVAAVMVVVICVVAFAMIR